MASRLTLGNQGLTTARRAAAARATRPRCELMITRRRSHEATESGSREITRASSLAGSASRCVCMPSSGRTLVSLCVCND
jgi:hypothetical protein